VEIGRIQRALVEHGWKIGFQPLAAAPRTTGRVAVVGSGPAGLSCAAELAREGYAVTVFEEHAEPGGVIRYGVPSYRFDADFLRHEMEDLEHLGVTFQCNTRIEGSAGARKLLREGFTAVFLAPGLWGADRIPGGDAVQGVFSSVLFLAMLREGRFEELGALVSGKTVAVIGGGSVAMDCVESAVKLGANDAYLVYRRSFAQMPAEEEERLAALRQGVHFLLLNQPVGYVAGPQGTLVGVELVRTRLGAPDSSGRRAPQEVKGTEWVLDAQVAVEAIGNRPDKADWSALVRTDKGGLVVVDPQTGRTSAQAVYAGGDAARGPGLVVEAVQDGKRAARAIVAALR
jgi:NADPH-dependent glutamate synthase beta subunit-like oxidoreductase